jgi:hypothetical protein
VIRKTRSPMELEIAREEIKREMKRYPNESLEDFNNRVNQTEHKKYARSRKASK